MTPLPPPWLRLCFGFVFQINRMSKLCQPVRVLRAGNRFRMLTLYSAGRLLLADAVETRLNRHVTMGCSIKTYF